MAVSNAIAPEHLELMVDDPEPLRRRWSATPARSSPAPWSPASVGDYVAGPSHVLPTFGSARFGQALTVADFTKHVHVITWTNRALRSVGPPRRGPGRGGGAARSRRLRSACGSA